MAEIFADSMDLKILLSIENK